MFYAILGSNTGYQKNSNPSLGGCCVQNTKVNDIVFTWQQILAYLVSDYIVLISIRTKLAELSSFKNCWSKTNFSADGNLKWHHQTKDNANLIKLTNCYVAKFT